SKHRTRHQSKLKVHIRGILRGFNVIAKITPSQGIGTKKIPPSSGDWRDTKAGPALTADYFCQVRFLWRLDFKRLRRLCLFIWRRRFFLRLPIGKRCLVERKPSLKRVLL